MSEPAQMVIARMRAEAEREAAANTSELRDRFAMAALTGIMAGPSIVCRDRGQSLESATAELAYRQADAMLAARSEGRAE